MPQAPYAKLPIQHVERKQCEQHENRSKDQQERNVLGNARDGGHQTGDSDQCEEEKAERHAFLHPATLATRLQKALITLRTPKEQLDPCKLPVGTSASQLIRTPRRRPGRFLGPASSPRQERILGAFSDRRSPTISPASIGALRNSTAQWRPCMTAITWWCSARSNFSRRRRRSNRGRCCSTAATAPGSSPTRPRRPRGYDDLEAFLTATTENTWL